MVPYNLPLRLERCWNIAGSSLFLPPVSAMQTLNS